MSQAMNIQSACVRSAMARILNTIAGMPSIITNLLSTPRATRASAWKTPSLAVAHPSPTAT